MVFKEYEKLIKYVKERIADGLTSKDVIFLEVNQALFDYIINEKQSTFKTDDKINFTTAKGWKLTIKAVQMELCYQLFEISPLGALLETAIIYYNIDEFQKWIKTESKSQLKGNRYTALTVWKPI